jgi:hypothetical protein
MPGGDWRILVHGDYHRGMARKSWHFTSDPDAQRRHDEVLAGLSIDDCTSVTILPGTDFDELVIGHWIHLEQMNADTWWMGIGGVTVHVTADRAGKPTLVRVNMPGTYDGPVEGCEYHLDDEPYPT